MESILQRIFELLFIALDKVFYWGQANPYTLNCCVFPSLLGVLGLLISVVRDE
jgi:hypothetical protein